MMTSSHPVTPANGHFGVPALGTPAVGGSAFGSTAPGAAHSPSGRQGVPASPALRVGSYLLDLLAVAACAAIAWLIRPSLLLVGIIAVEVFIVLSLLRARTGRTLGSLATHTVAVAAGSDHAPGLKRQALRSLIIALAHLTLIAPVIIVWCGKNGRDWVDSIAGTATLDVRAPRERVSTVPDAYGRRTTASPSLLNSGWSGPQSPSPMMINEAGSRRPARPVLPARPPQPVQTVQPVQTLQPVQQPRPVRPPQAPQTQVPPQLTPLAQPTVTNAFSVTIPDAPAAPLQPDHSGKTEQTEPDEVWIVFDSGDKELVSGTMVIGRAPVTMSPNEHAVTIKDSTRSLSRTHLRLGQADNGVWVEDAFSANGTSVALPDGTTHELERGKRQIVPLGTTLHLGERSLTINCPTMHH